jgi:hypothetical protein
MTPMFPEGENNRLGAHAARPEPVPESSSRIAFLVRAPEGFAIHREPSAGAVPVLTDARRGYTTHASAPAEGVTIRALTSRIISIGRHPPCLMRN